MNEQDTPALTFPCEFPIKIMGRAEADFETLAVEIVSRHVVDIAVASVSTRPSRDGTYLSVTITILATSRAQLDDIYRDLSAHERVLMAL